MTQSSDPITARLAEYAVSASNFPENVRQEALRSFFNLLGCAIGGARHPIVDTADAALGAFGGPRQATLFARGRKSDVPHATLINCLASSVYSYDDTHAQAVVHPAGPIASAVLAFAEWRPLSGADLLDAFTIGVELECRLSKGVSVPPAKGPMAWSGTGISAGFGTAAAIGRLMKLDIQRMRCAMGIALAQAAGFRHMHGSAMTPMMPAQAARNGVQSAVMAEHGYTAGLSALEGHYGYLSLFCETPDLDTLAGRLGTHFEVLSNTYKAYPCGIVIQPIIDACLQLRRDHAPAPDAIAKVDIAASPGAMALCNNRNPKDELQAHVSLHHWTAVAFIRGTARIQDMDTETAVKDPALVAFQDKVEATLDPSLAGDATVVTLTMTDGTKLSRRIDHCIGSAINPMTNADLEDKFVGLSEPVVGATRTREIVAKTWDVAALADAGELARACA